ncbi:MAG: hypothetical protein K0Q50_793 [Vampirovibrio sp.]|nr:hypothetical protein [Vampirovibrio sp.]
MPLSRFTRRFLMTKPSSRALRLARQNWLGPIQCYYPDNLTPAWKNIPFATRLIRQPLQIPLRPNIYQVARRYADDILNDIERLLPDFFQIGDWDFRFAFRFNLQFHIAYQGLPLVYSMLQEQSPPASALTLVDCHLTPDLVYRFAEDMGIGKPKYPLRSLSTLHSERLMRKLSQWKSQAISQEEETFSGGTLAVIPHSEHLELLKPILGVLKEQEPVRLLNIHSKLRLSEQQFDGMTVQHLSGLRLGPQLEIALHHFKKLRDEVQRLPAKQRHFCYTQIDLLADLAEKFMSFEATIRRLQPDTVIGCLEFNLHGAFLSMLQKQSPGFRLMNLQHGIVAPTWTVDGLRFDDYFLWNKQTAKSLEQNGYPVGHRMHVIGNPKWEALADQVASETTSAEYDKLLAWKGDAPLIGAYTQCLQGYSTVQIKKDYLLSLIGYLQYNPNAKLLIKRHPLETDDVVDTVVRASGCQDRIQVYESERLMHWEILKAVDIVTSVFSATLYESLYLQKPTLALDFDRVIETQQIPWPGECLTVTEPKSVNAALDYWLTLEPDKWRFLTANQFTSIVPRFNIPFALRFRQLAKIPTPLSASSN